MSYQIHSMAFEFWGFDGMINEVGRFFKNILSMCQKYAAFKVKSIQNNLYCKEFLTQDENM